MDKLRQEEVAKAIRDLHEANEELAEVLDLCLRSRVQYMEGAIVIGDVLLRILMAAECATRAANATALLAEMECREREAEADGD